MDGFYIILKNSLGCEIDRKFVAGNEESANLNYEVRDFVQHVGISPGDTIHVEDGWQED